MTTPAIAYRTVRSVGFRHGGAALLRWNSSVVDVSPLKFEPPAPPTKQHDKLQEDAKKKIFQDAVAADHVRHNWTRQEIAAIYYQPLLELAYQAVRLFSRSRAEATFRTFDCPTDFCSNII